MTPELLLQFRNDRKIGEIIYDRRSDALNVYFWGEDKPTEDDIFKGNYAFYVMWEAGHWWSRSYDSEWNDVSESRDYTPEAEPMFTSLLEYLVLVGSDLQESDFTDLIHTTSWCGDEYYGGTVYDVKYIKVVDVLDRIDFLAPEWLKDIKDLP